MNTPTTEALNTSELSISNSEQTLYLAKDLAKFIQENRLSMQIQGKNYVLVEGWSYAGGRLGILPVVKGVEVVATPDDEIKYQSWVELKNIRTNEIVGSGFALCSNRESGKRYFQEYAIASMAQTRAIGKAYRNLLAWIIRAAGYEPTPAEEMDFLTADSKPEGRLKATPAPKHKHPEDNLGEEYPSQWEKDFDKESAPPRKKAQPPMASAKQKTELLLLLNNRHITNDEKAKMIESFNTFDSERIQQAIAKVKKVIEERDNLAAQNSNNTRKKGAAHGA